MRWCASLGMMLVAAVMIGGDVAGNAAPATSMQRAETSGADPAKIVDVELVLALDISYSMDIDELALQREGYAQAIVSKEFMQALKSGPTGRIAVTISSGRPPPTRRSCCPGR